MQISTNRKWVLSFSLMATLALGSDRAIANEIEFVPLGGFDGGDGSSSAFDVSGDGTTVVGRAEGPQGSEAFRWTRGEGMVGLGDIAGLRFGSAALAVSSDGSVIVGEGTGDRGRNEALIWRDAGLPERLGSLSASSTYASAIGVSFDGETVLGTTVQPNRVYGPFMWTPAVGMQPLVDTPSRYSSWALALSEDGRTALVAEATSRLWTQETGLVDIDPSGDFQATGMSADGTFVVGSLRVTCPSGSGVCTEAALWTAAGGIARLGWLDDPLDPEPQAVAVDVSRDGLVVVGMQGDRALVWDDRNGMRDLSSIMLDGGVDPSDWLDLEPVAISDDGVVMVGTGTRVAGHDEAWLVVLPSEPEPDPEPASTLRIGLLDLDFWRWHRPMRDARVSVVLFGSADFDVRDVDVETLTFGPGEAAAISSRSRHHGRHHRGRRHHDRHHHDRRDHDRHDRHAQQRGLRDLNRDGYDDLISHYRASQTGLELGMENDAAGVCLQGQTMDGEPFESCLGAEDDPLCGFGYELTLLVPVIVRARRRRSGEGGA